MPRIITVTITAMALALSACSESNTAQDHGAHKEEQQAQQPTNRIDIPATVRNNIGITFANVERRRIDSTLRIPGAFELQPRARHEYRMPLPGQVEFLVDQFEPVEPGDILFRFRSPQWPDLMHEIIESEQAINSARADIEVAQAHINESQAKLRVLNDRLRSLEKADFQSAPLRAEAAELEASLPRLRAELNRANTNLENALSAQEHALHRASASTGIDEATLAAPIAVNSETLPAYRTIDWIDVRALEAGVVESLAVTNGSFADVHELVISTVEPTRVRFRAMALQSDLARLSTNLTARIASPSDPDDSVSAEVTIGLQADPAQRTVTLLATPTESRNWIRPGVSAFLEVVVSSTSGPALAIPRSAVVKDGITHVFFRRDPNDANKAIRVEADLGPSDGRWIAINSGLTLNDQVVLDGAYELKLATQQSGVAQKGGHFHADGTFHAEDH